MLTELSIENFAIIDRLMVRFEPGFTVLTGETGAGKSIIIDALQASLGARVGSDVVREGERLAAVEAVFEMPETAESLRTVLEENGLEDEDCLILRREINVSGRGSARVNGRAVPLAVLSTIGSALVDIHGQSEHLSVLRRDRQLDVLDSFGDLSSLRARVRDAVRAYIQARRELDELSDRGREMEQRSDLLRFQVGEIEAAALSADEVDQLQAERTLLANAERLTALSSAASAALHGESNAAVDLTGEAVTALHELSGIDPSLTALAERLQSAQYELEDIAQEVRQYRDAIEYDPRRLEVIEERLDLLSRLMRKYGPSLEDVLAFGHQAREELDQLENLDAHLAELAGRAATAEREAGELAWELSGAREVAADSLTSETTAALQGLGLKDTSFRVQLEKTEAPEGLRVPGGERFAYSASGIDAVSFLVSFNPGEPLRPIERVASGGETSRFLLALKSVLADADNIPTLIFDEVDVGVGARSGMVVGERLRQLAAGHQVITITHLPQVAALADHHLTVLKRVSGGRTGVEALALEDGGRITEIAEMMSGTGSEAALRIARELLESARSPSS